MFETESDRGAAVLAASYAENQLGLYLKEFMTDKSLCEKIFESNGVLSSFSQRIDFAQAFGFLTKELCQELHLIRKIRNHFAHHPKNASFTSEPVKGWVGTLRASKEVELPEGLKFKLSDPRIAYLISVGMLVIIANNKIYGYGNPEVDYQL